MSDAEHGSHAEADDLRREGMDILQPDIGNQVESDRDRGDEQDREDDQADEYAFLWFGHVLKNVSS